MHNALSPYAVSIRDIPCPLILRKPRKARRYPTIWPDAEYWLCGVTLLKFSLIVFLKYTTFLSRSCLYQENKIQQSM